MADVFISYANEDRERAEQLASALEARSWSVWWDRGVIPGERFDDVIQRELEAAKSEASWYPRLFKELSLNLAYDEK